MASRLTRRSLASIPSSSRRAFSSLSYVPHPASVEITPLPPRAKPPPFFYTGQPQINARIHSLTSLQDSVKTRLKTARCYPAPDGSGEAEERKWLGREEMCALIGVGVMRPTEYGLLLSALQSLNALSHAATIASDALSVSRIASLLTPFIALPKVSSSPSSSSLTSSSTPKKPTPANYNKETVPLDSLGRSRTTGTRKDARAEVWMAYTPALAPLLSDASLRERLDAARKEAEGSKKEKAAEAKKQADAGARSLAPAWRALDQKERTEAAREEYRRTHGYYPIDSPTRLNPPPPTSSTSGLDVIPLPLPSLHSPLAIRPSPTAPLRILYQSIQLLRADPNLSAEEKLKEERRVVVEYNNAYPWPALANERAAIGERVGRFEERAKEVLEAQKRVRDSEKKKGAEEGGKEEKGQEMQGQIEELLSGGSDVSESSSSSASPAASVESTSSSSTSASTSSSSPDSEIATSTPPPSSLTTSPSPQNSNSPSTSPPQSTRDGTLHIPLSPTITSHLSNPNPDPLLGLILLNNTPLHRFFPNPRDRETVLRPFRLTGTIGAFNVFGLVQNGGSTGQAGAVQLAVARGLVGHNELFRGVLAADGLLTPDTRQVERKKTGQPKARKKETWVKR